MGDVAFRTAPLLPDYPWHARWPHKYKTEQLDCNYLLLSDNLLDQTHAAYVHKSTLASNVDAYERAEMKITPTEDGVKFIRWMLNCVPPGIYAKAVKFTGRVDRWGEFEYVAPSCILQFTGASDVGEGAYEERSRRRFRASDLLRHHAGNRAYELVHVVGRQRLSPERAGRDGRTVQPKSSMLSRKTKTCSSPNTRSLRKLGDRPLINIASDGARIHARLALERKIAKERGIPREQVVTLA